MEENGGSAFPAAAVNRPSVSLPARSAVESLFRGGPAEASPGPMTLASSLFEPDSEYRSFSQLLDCAMMDSPAMFSSNLGNLGISHEHALSQVTAQAGHPNNQISRNQTKFPSSISSSSLVQPVSAINMAASQPIHSTTYSEHIPNIDSALASHFDQRSQPVAIVADKPADDGYNWRKYGQKQVKGCEYPRSYYKCTQLKCPVKKKVERSIDGQVTEIIYKGQHNHDRPIPNRRSKEAFAELNGNYGPHNFESLQQDDSSNFNRSSDDMSGLSKKEWESGHGFSEQLVGSSDDDDLGDDEVEDGEPEHKRRNLETRVIESSSHRTVTEPRIILQTTSEIDLLNDGYRWRKYGQKIVKGNPHPRSYYKCTSTGCNVRKHVERASTDAKAVVTTYEGKHNHVVPAPKNSSHNATSSAPSANRTTSFSHDISSNNQNSHGRSDQINNNVYRPAAVLQLKGDSENTEFSKHTYKIS